MAHKHDSQDICFVPDHDYAGFIERETGRKDIPGNFVDEEGRIIGRHKGITHYTVGQRKGLGIPAETRLFVKEIRPESNEVVICKSDSLFSDVCLVDDMNYMAVSGIEAGKQAIGKIRYSHRGAPCHLYPVGGGLVECHFEEPQRGITPGQAAVFYQGEHILCGGTIR